MVSNNTSLGPLPETWEVKTTQEYFLTITDYVSNGSFKTLADNVKYNVGDKFAVLIRLTDYNNDFSGEFIYINKSAYEFLSKTKLYGGEIIIANVGANVGTVFLAPKLNKHMSLGPNSIMLKTRGNDTYFYYWFKSRFGQKSIQSIISGSAQPKFNKTSFRKLNIPVPPLDAQNAIVDILSSLDEKIEFNNKINIKLEELAQTLYKRWFVDFEFPNEEGKPYKSSGGEMVESELGLIPKGWEVVYLDKLFSFERGVEPGSKNYSSVKLPGYVPFIRVGDLESKSNNYVSIDLIKDKTCMEEDVLVSFDGAVGRVAMGHDGAYSTGIRKIHSFVKDIDFSFTYLLFKSQFIQDQIQSYANGTTIMHAGSSIKHLIAPLNIKLIAEFSLIIRPMIKQILNNMKQNESLALTRDLLLPKLMSGEIEV